tara:strand:+ start:3349 stop:4059 length:711 start_codon:yes stop_codon:yes gene_type:complete
MKKISILMFLLFSFVSISGQKLVGAWERIYTPENGQELKSIVIFSDNYQTISTYELSSGKFISSNGGSWNLKANLMSETVEFDTENNERVGDTIEFEIKLKENELSIVDSDMIFKRIDSGKPGKLQGAWLMSGRVRDGKKQLRDVNRPRKTMKILSGTRFQWIAYNTETKQFMGTGGGTYTTINGEYKESIDFFSRDDSKAGIELKFDYNIIDNEWNHQGFSSKGDPLHEIWIKRN